MVYLYGSPEQPVQTLSAAKNNFLLGVVIAVVAQLSKKGFPNKFLLTKRNGPQAS